MPNKKWYWTEAMDAFLRHMYDPIVPGRSQELARRLNVPRWAVNRRAAALGLSRPKDSPWSRQDEAHLEANLHRVSVKTLARSLGRSPTAVKLKAKRLGLRKHDEGYTASSLAEALGVDPHWVLTRIRSGKLRASHRHTERTAQQGGDSWLITDEALVDFVREHPYDIDLRKVDSLWFMDLIAPYLQRTATEGRRFRAACSAFSEHSATGRERQMISTRRRNTKRNRRGAPWTEEEDARLLVLAQLPPRRVADLMRRSWLACRRRLIYLRADDSRPLDSHTLRSSSAR